MRGFIEGYLGSYPIKKQPSYVGFRDRDFDQEPSETSALIRLPGQKPIYLSHRAAVENYLIDAGLIHRYWKEREGAPAWQYGPAPPEDEIQDHIQESARELIGYQAVRWALSRLKPDSRWPEIRTSWTGGSGDIPSSLDYDDCLAQACQLVTSFQDQVRQVRSDALRENAKAYHKRFNAPSFL
jgi:hypothetical protein